MKKTTAAILAAVLSLSLTACKKEPAPQPTPPPPGVTQPEAPVAPTPTTPEPPKTPEKPAVAPPTGAAVVKDRDVTGSVEETVSYRILLPEVETENPEAAQIINAYYGSVSGKLNDLAWGELYEQALNQHTVMALSTAYTVPFNQNNLISVCRRVITRDENTSVQEESMLAETFNLQNGGLVTLDDLFSVPEAQYLPRLTAGVRQLVEQDPYHAQNYVSDWETAVTAAFDKASFFLTPQGINLFYQEDELQNNTESTFTLTWDTLADILKEA